MDVRGAPIVVGDFIVFPTHSGPGGEWSPGSSPEPDPSALVGFHVVDREFYSLTSLYTDPGGEPTGRSSEGSPQLDPEFGRLYWGTDNAANEHDPTADSVQILDSESYAPPSGVEIESLEAAISAEGVLLKEEINSPSRIFYVGTKNTTGSDDWSQACNAGPEDTGDTGGGYHVADCGGVFGVSESGELVARLDVESLPTLGRDPYLTWHGAGLTSDGEQIFTGGSASYYKGGGVEEYEGQTFTGSCQAVALQPVASPTGLDRFLIAGVADAGEYGCLDAGMTGSMDAVAGEVLVEGDGELWVQWANPGEQTLGDLPASVMHLSNDMRLLCEATISPTSGALWPLGYTMARIYQGPTQIEDDAVYVLFWDVNGSDESGSTEHGLTSLYRIEHATPNDLECEVSEVHNLAGRVGHSPTLVSISNGPDLAVLAVSDPTAPGFDGEAEREGGVQIVDLSGAPGDALILEVPLPDNDVTLGSPIFHDGAIWIVQSNGTVNRLEIEITPTFGGPTHPLTDYGDAHWPRKRRDNNGNACVSVDPATSRCLP